MWVSFLCVVVDILLIAYDAIGKRATAQFILQLKAPQVISHIVQTLINSPVMNARVDHVIDAALALVPQERYAVVLALLDSLDGEDESLVARAWQEEIQRRKEGIRTGAIKMVPWAEARARLAAL